MTETNQTFIQTGGPAAYLNRDFAKFTEVLETWLTERIAGAAGLTVSDISRPVGAGMSNETLLFKARWRSNGRSCERDLVARIAPGAYRLFRTPAFEKQFRLLDMLHRKGLVKVPEMIGFEADERLLGDRFFVMSRLVGRVPVSFPLYNAAGFVFDATPAQRHALWESALVELTRIHQVPDADVAFLDQPELGATGFDQLFAEWVASYAWMDNGRTVPALETILEWLCKHLPRDQVDGLSWGDARIGNMMFGDDFRLVGVMDWEQISLGGALQDLGWWLFFDDAQSFASGVQRLDGLGTRSETIALWQQLTVRAVTDLLWYEVFAGFKLGTLVARKHAIEKGGDRPGHNANNNVFTRLAFDRMGITRPVDIINAPEGASANAVN